MKHFQAAALLVLPVLLSAQESDPKNIGGLWSYVILLPPGGLKKVIDGKAEVAKLPRGYAAPTGSVVPGALASTPKPSYKPEMLAKVKDLFDHESKTDPVFYCAQPGIPRIGPPRRIIQLPGEMVFLYEDVAGDPYRVIPTDGRGHRANGNPTFYGDSTGRWEGNAFIVDSTNFVEDTWFGEDGYFHSDAFHVTERFWRVGENLAYQATVEDPKVLAAPWVMPVKVVKPSTDALEESPRCVETDASRLVNSDHHAQR